LAKSLKDDMYQISISDLYVSVPNGERIVLFSKKLQKEIIPMHTNAYNFTLNPVLVHYFLCLLQSQYSDGLTFNWGILLSTETFLPRVVYKKIILSPATWIVNPEEVKDFKGKIESDEFLSMAEKFRHDRKIPEQVFLVNGDNKLLIDFKNKISVMVLFRSFLKSKCTLNECFDYSEKVLKNQGKGFKNEIIVNYYLNN
jgi:hypothetical protein